MKHTKNKEKRVSEKGVAEEVQKILAKRGSKALEEARKQVLEERVECKGVREALTYFMSEYWRDVARPALLSLACEAVGGDPDATTPIAVSMTLISGAIDIHDDIIDHSMVKGSRQTVLGKFGEDMALLVGDALLFKGFTLLYKSVERGIPAEKLPIIIEIIKQTFFELGDAEAIELQFRGRTDVTPEEYLRVVKKKAADVEAHTRISAILGGGSKEEVEALGEYGRLLGMLIILRDDLIDMIDLEEAVHRIKRECLPLPILYALQDPKIKPEISALLLKEKITKKDAEKILKVTYRAEGLRHMMKFMQELATDAYTYIEHLSKSKRELTLLTKGMLIPEWQNFTRSTIS